MPLRLLLGLLLAGLCLGCSQETKEQTREALDQTGDALKAAAEDTKENAKKAAGALEAGAESAREAWDKDDDDAPAAEGGAADADQSAAPADSAPSQR